MSCSPARAPASVFPFGIGPLSVKLFVFARYDVDVLARRGSGDDGRGPRHLQVLRGLNRRPLCLRDDADERPFLHDLDETLDAGDRALVYAQRLRDRRSQA